MAKYTVGWYFHAAIGAPSEAFRTAWDAKIRKKAKSSATSPARGPMRKMEGLHVECPGPEWACVELVSLSVD